MTLAIELRCDNDDDDDDDEEDHDKVVDNKGNTCSINNIYCYLTILCELQNIET